MAFCSLEKGCLGINFCQMGKEVAVEERALLRNATERYAFDMLR